MGEFVPAIRAVDLAEGAISAVDLKGRHVLLSRIGGGFFAVSGTCTHEDTDLGMGVLLEERIICPLHLSQFDLRTGEVMNPPATVPLRRFNVKIKDEGIFVEI